MKNEKQIELSFIEKLKELKYIYREDIKDKASLEENISNLTMKLFVIRRTITMCKECVEEKIYLAVSMAVIDGMPYRTISDKISYSTPQVSRYISQFFKNLECYKAFLKAKEEAVQLCFCMKKETNETQSERHET